MIDQSGTLVVDRRAASAAFRGVARNDRVEVCKFAKQGTAHPDPAVAAAAANWARAVQVRGSSRLPPFVLPLCGLILIFAGFYLTPNDLSSQTVGVVGGGLAFIAGLLAWNNHSIAKRVLALPKVELVDD